jgi:hypothetical protein
MCKSVYTGGKFTSRSDKGRICPCACLFSGLRKSVNTNPTNAKSFGNYDQGLTFACAWHYWIAFRAIACLFEELRREGVNEFIQSVWGIGVKVQHAILYFLNGAVGDFVEIEGDGFFA